MIKTSDLRKDLKDGAKESVRSKFGHRCAGCGRESDLDVAHVIPLHFMKTMKSIQMLDPDHYDMIRQDMETIESVINQEDNLVLLCRDCHNLFDGKSTGTMQKWLGERQMRVGHFTENDGEGEEGPAKTPRLIHKTALNSEWENEREKLVKKIDGLVR